MSPIWAGLACSLMAPALLTSCLQKTDLSTDTLTAVDDPSPGTGASAAGKAAGDAAGQPRGAQANAAMLGEDAAKGAGSGGTAADAAPADGNAAGSDHVDRPAGFPDGATGEGSGGEANGAPSPVPFEVRPPGYGSNLPAQPKPEAVPGPTGGAPKGGPSTPGQPDQAPPSRETQFEAAFKGKPMVTVSGEITYAGKTDQSIDLDCFAPDKSTPAGRKLVNKVKLDAVGPYSFKVPANFGKLILSAFVDLKGDGPDRNDPQATYAENPLEVKDKNLTKVNLVLKAPTGSAK